MKFSGIPLSSAVIVLHDPEGAQPIASESGTLSTAAVHRLDYDGRMGAWESDGGCVREATEFDGELMARASLDASASRQLDYVARMYGFAGKGAGKMTDATYWGQHGPIPRDRLEAEMLACGGTFMKSVVSVDRRYASELGLDSKQSFERLMRDKWVDSVLKWGVTDRAEDVRWVANYHDDAEHSLHVHVTTFFAGKSPEPGWNITSAATRAAKLELYRSAYSAPMLERDRVQDYLRDLLPAIARCEMGVPNERGCVERIERKAAELGVTPVLERTVDARASERLARGVEAMESEYAKGSGRLSSNWRLMGEARSVCDVLYRTSAPYREAYDAYREAVERKADVNGLAVQRPHDSSLREEPTPSQRVTMHERKRFVSAGMDDMKARVSRALIRDCVPSARRDSMLRDELRAITKGAVSSAMRMHGDNALGLDARRSAEVVRCLRDSGNPESVERAARIIAASPEISGAVAKASDRIASDPLVASRQTPAQVLDTARGRIVSEIGRTIGYISESGRLDPDRAAARGLSREIARDMPVLTAALRDDGIRLGLSLSQHAELSECVERAQLGTSDDGARDAEAQRAFERAVDIIMASPVVTRAVDEHARSVSEDPAVPDKTARAAGTRVVRESVEKQLEHKCASEERSRSRIADDREREDYERRGGGELSSLLGALARSSAMRGGSHSKPVRKREDEQVYTEQKGKGR